MEGVQIDQIMATLAEVLVHANFTLEAAVVATAEVKLEFISHGMAYLSDGEWDDLERYDLVLTVPLPLYTQIIDQLSPIQDTLRGYIHDITSGIKQEYISSVRILPAMSIETEFGWREKTIAYLAGQGVNNQGKVRSDNIAPFTHRGLLFRSKAEINFFEALQSLGVSFAPLPVFIRGGVEYRRIEPDFIIIKEGITMVVEIDGDTFHHETPAEAQNRTLMLENEGARIIHIQASECDSPEKAKMAAKRVLEILAKIKAAGR